MLARPNVSAVLFLIAMAIVPVRESYAEDCSVPEVPNLPGTLSDDANADQVSQTVDDVMTVNFEYLACLNEFLEADVDQPSEQERRQLEGLISARLARLNALANQWNGMYTSYVNRKLRSK